MHDDHDDHDGHDHEDLDPSVWSDLLDHYYDEVSPRISLLGSRERFVFDKVRDCICFEQFGATELFEVVEGGFHIKLISNIAIEAVASMMALEHLEALGLASPSEPRGDSDV